MTTVSVDNARITEQEVAGLGIDDLRELMTAVDHTARQLVGTNEALQMQVSRLKHELAEANSQLRRSRSLAALGEMAAGIAHEIRNPLGSIRLYNQLLADDVADRPQSADLCDKVNHAVTRMDVIVGDVLQFARDTVVRPTPTTPVDLLDQALANCAAAIEVGDVAIIREIDSDPEVSADVSLMVQALSNLICNAVEAMNEHDASTRRLCLGTGSRTVRCPDGTRDERVFLRVADSGPGIPDEAIGRIFNPFFTTRPSGTGLGLAIVHRIVDAHGGHLRADNLPAGGACMEIFLPVHGSLSASESDLVSDGSLSASLHRRIHQEGNS